ncbi:MAG: hypothetical protein P1P64_04800 [Treponemataceae bacterium]
MLDLLADGIAKIVDIVFAVWDYIKRIVVGILNFTRNIVKFFKDPSRLQKLQKDRDLLAIAVKENLENGEYNVVNCLFDKATSQIVDMDEDALGIEAEELDAETEAHFGDKDMLVLQ